MAQAIADTSHVIREAARQHNADGYAAALLAPRDVRDDLIAVAAFLGEVRRIPLIAGDANLALIRLQWWRDAIGKRDLGVESGNPVADAFVRTLRKRGIAERLALAPLDAAEAELSAEPPGAAAFAAYLDDAGVSALQLAARCLGVAETAATPSFLEAAGRSLAAVQLALALPYHMRHGRLPVPAAYRGTDLYGVPSEDEARRAITAATAALAATARTHLSQMRHWQAGVGRGAVTAALPVAVCAAYLDALDRPGRDPLREPADVSPLRRMMALWLAHWRRRV